MEIRFDDDVHVRVQISYAALLLDWLQATILVGVESPKIVRHSSQNVGMLPVNKQR